jgi:hypothetical protein
MHASRSASGGSLTRTVAAPAKASPVVFTPAGIDVRLTLIEKSPKGPLTFSGPLSPPA